MKRQDIEICGRMVSVTQLATDTGWSKGYVSMLLAGNRAIAVPNLIKLSKVLGVDPGILAVEIERRREHPRPRRGREHAA
jgi:transcriptional regulator with XRE-family HTH domain